MEEDENPESESIYEDKLTLGSLVDGVYPVAPP